MKNEQNHCNFIQKPKVDLIKNLPFFIPKPSKNNSQKKQTQQIHSRI